MSTLTFHLDNLPRTRVNAIKRRAKELGVTQDRYIKKLIEDDLAQERRARTMTFDEIAAPFRKAFDGVSDDELDRLVDAARTHHHQRTKRKRVM